MATNPEASIVRAGEVSENDSDPDPDRIFFDDLERPESEIPVEAP